MNEKNILIFFVLKSCFTSFPPPKKCLINFFKKTKNSRPFLTDYYRFGICFRRDLGPDVTSGLGMDGDNEGAVFSTTFVASFVADDMDTPTEVNGEMITIFLKKYGSCF